MSVSLDKLERFGHRTWSPCRTWRWRTASPSCVAADAERTLVAPDGHGLGQVVRAEKFAAKGEGLM